MRHCDRCSRPAVWHIKAATPTSGYIRNACGVHLHRILALLVGGGEDEIIRLTCQADDRTVALWAQESRLEKRLQRKEPDR